MFGESNDGGAAAPRGRAPERGGARGLPRVGADHPAEVHLDGFHGPLACRTRDIGLGGVCVSTATVFALKSVNRVVLSLPTADGVVRIGFEAEGHWQREAPGEDAVYTGIRFTEISAEASELLWDVVMRSGRDLARFFHAQRELSGLGMEEGIGLAQITRFRDVDTGHVLFRGGAGARSEESIFLVLRGSLALVHRVKNARDATLASVGPGEIVGGLPLLTGDTSSEMVIAEMPTRLLEIDRESYAYLEAAKPWLAQRLAMAVLRSYGRRVQRLIARLGDAL